MSSYLLNASAMSTSVGSAVLGVHFHMAILPHEIDNQAWYYIFGYAGSLFVLYNCYLSVGYGFFGATAKTTLVGVSFVAGLLYSIFIYRAFTHRLRNIPGPFAARISKFYHAYIAATTMQNNVNIQKLHAQYGDFVRTGPREVSINRLSAIQKLYGPPKGLKRGPWYSHTGDDVTKIALISTIDFDLHRQRRRAWDRGLGFKALASYEPRVRSKVDLFLSRLATGQSVDVTEKGAFLAFDVMGDIGFSKEFKMLESNKKHPAIKALHENLVVIAVLGAVPWLLEVLAKIPGATGSFEVFSNWCYKECEAKKQEIAAAAVSDDEDAKTLSTPADVMSWLIKAKDENDRSAPPGEQALLEDAQLLIITGSDTVSGAIANVIYFLAKYPKTFQTLRKHIDAALPLGEQDWTYEKIKDIPYLQWVINESLRLRPAVPIGLQRVTPPEGLMIDEQYIPGDTVVSVPCDVIQRDPRYWDKPLEFMPERWENLSTEAGEKSAYIAFSRGPNSCPGKHLAYMEMKMALSKLALRYDMKFSGSEGGKDLDLFENGAKDTFTTCLPPLNMVFTPRK